MTEHAPIPEDHDPDERSPAEVLQSDRDVLAGELINATGKVEFFSAYGERPDTSETLENQRKLLEDYLEATRANLGAFDEANPGLRKLEEEPRRRLDESVEDFHARIGQPSIKVDDLIDPRASQ